MTSRPRWFARIGLICISLLLALSSLGILCACSGGIKGEDAKALTSDFFDAIVAEDYEKANTYLHADCYTDVEKLFTSVEQQANVNFGDGMTIEKYTSISSSYYASAVDGSTYELTMRVKVGEKILEITVGTVKNDKGFGISRISISP